jgi:hypothetical protein
MGGGDSRRPGSGEDGHAPSSQLPVDDCNFIGRQQPHILAHGMARGDRPVNDVGPAPKRHSRLDGWAGEWIGRLSLASNPMGNRLTGRTQPLSNLTPGDIVEVEGLNHSSKVTNPANEVAGGIGSVQGILHDGRIRNASEARNDCIELLHEQTYWPGQRRASRKRILARWVGFASTHSPLPIEPHCYSPLHLRYHVERLLPFGPRQEEGANQPPSSLVHNLRGPIRTPN